MRIAGIPARRLSGLEIGDFGGFGKVKVKTRRKMRLVHCAAFIVVCALWIFKTVKV